METSIRKRKPLIFALLLISALAVVSALAACGGNSTADKNASGSAAAASPAENGDIPYWNGFYFGPNLEYAEEYQLMSDPGEYLNPAEAAKLTFDTMRDNGNIPDYSDGTEYTMTLVDLTDIEDGECYVYRLDIDAPENDTLGAAYAYAYQSGNIYMQGQMGIWVIPE